MRGVTCRAPNCTVSLSATSNVMMRPVILSRPENTAVGLAIFGPGGVMISLGCGGSPGCDGGRGGGGRCAPGAPGGAAPAPGDGSGWVCTPGGTRWGY